MGATLYFYDLETSGVSARSHRIMQFAGQRTDLNLKPIGPADSYYIKITDDHLPDPDAVLITGITPQRTLSEGITEVEFLRYFTDKIAIAETIFVGYNTIRFDDEFMRFLHYRNFYDPYAWHWQDKRSRWDLLDVVRMTRALRPEGIKWPFGTDGKASNRLELLTSINELDHENAHDALSDVLATIAMARLIRNKQPKLFDFLLSIRSKSKVQKLIEAGEPFVYTSGKYPSAYEKTTVVISLGDHPNKQGVLVFDLRADPTAFKGLSPSEMAEAWLNRPEDESLRFPVKTLQFNRCPAVAPIQVLDKSSQKRLKIDLKQINKNLKALKNSGELYQKLIDALKLMDEHRQATFIADQQDVDSLLYDDFISDGDGPAMSVVRAADEDSIANLQLEFKDDRLNKLLPLYKARNFPKVIGADEKAAWEKYRYQKLMSGGDKSSLSRYFNRLAELGQRTNLTKNQRYILEELQLYAESIFPEPLDLAD